MKFKNIDHVVITTQNLQKCLHFYVDVLGMKQMNPIYGSLDLCLIIDGSLDDAKREITEKGYPMELGSVTRHGALGGRELVFFFIFDGIFIFTNLI